MYSDILRMLDGSEDDSLTLVCKEHISYYCTPSSIQHDDTNLTLDPVRYLHALRWGTLI